MYKRYLVGAIFLAAILALIPFSYGQEAQAPIGVSISTDRDVYVAGEPIRINVQLTNNSAKRVWIVKPQEGSEQGFRYPYCIFEILDEKGVPVQDDSPACKTVDPVFKDGFFYLKPGQGVSLYKGGYRIDEAKTLPQGEYTIIFSYSTEAAKESQWYGLYADDFWAARNKDPFWKKRAGKIKDFNKSIRKVPRLSIASNPITIKVVGVTGIPKEEALKIAQEVCEKEGWEWRGVNVVDNGTYWDINTNWGSLGSNALIRIDKRTGEVLEKHLTGP